MEIPIALVNDTKRGDCIVVAGAGLSAGAGMPLASDIREILGNEIEKNISDYDYKFLSFPSVARAYEMVFDRAHLCQILEKSLQSIEKEISVSEVHRILIENFKTIVTTNWDNLFEKAADQLGVPYCVVTRDKEIAFITGEKKIIIKMHGSMCQPDTLVVTTSDYDNYDMTHPGIIAFLKSLFSRKTILFIGYSLRDEHFRRILSTVNHYLGGLSRKAYAIDPYVDKIQEMDLADRGIMVIRYKAKEFLETLFEKPEKLTISDVSNLSVESLLRIRNYIDDQITRHYEKEVTVMFTDMVGSTTFFANRGAIAGRALLQRHNDIIFSLVKGEGGEIVKTLGDGVLCSFSNAYNAVRASVEIQKALASYNANARAGEDIHIRIGIDTGPAIFEKGNFFGDTIALAARVQGIAEPDEILISERTFEKLDLQLKERCQKIGEKQLRGFNKKHCLYVVLWSQ